MRQIQDTVMFDMEAAINMSAIDKLDGFAKYIADKDKEGKQTRCRTALRYYEEYREKLMEGETHTQLKRKTQSLNVRPTSEPVKGNGNIRDFIWFMVLTLLVTITLVGIFG